MEEQNKENEFLKPEEIAALVQVPLKWVRNHSCKIPGYVRVGHHVRYRRSSVMIALNSGKLLKD